MSLYNSALKQSKLKHLGSRILVVLILVLCTGVLACTAPVPTATPAQASTPQSTLTPVSAPQQTPEITPVPATAIIQTPTPAITQTATPTATQTTVPTPSPTLTTTPTPVPTPTPAPVPLEVNITRNEVKQNLPNSLTFLFEGFCTLPAANIDLEYGTSKRSLVSEVTRASPQYTRGSRTTSASYIWEMKKTGSLPPGAMVWWRWRITDELKQSYVTPRQSIILEDTRYRWQSQVSKDINIYWYSQETGFGESLTQGIESNLSRIELKVTIPEEMKIKVFVYASTDDLKNAVLFAQEWTGALAFTDYNIILIGIGQGQLEWGKQALAHEITHLLVREATFGPFGDIPTWLNEGLARYAEGPLTASKQEDLKQAIANNKLLSIRSLSSSFPADPTTALLAYTESHSLVSYLIETYGWAKTRELLTVFKEGSTYDNALQKVYSFDTDSLEKSWKAYIGSG